MTPPGRDRCPFSFLASTAIAGLLLAAAGMAILPMHPVSAKDPADGYPLSLSPSRAGSMGLFMGPAGSAEEDIAHPYYDEQIGTTFTQNLTSIVYNVTALAQTDVAGYGPAYLLNGVTDKGYWYQVGLSYDWPDSDGGYFPSFAFNFEVFAPGGASVYPTEGSGLQLFSAPVRSGDTVLVILIFAGSSVVMEARDWETGATASASFSNFGASVFVGNQYSISDLDGFFSGLMTEWYHGTPYSGSEGGVEFSNQGAPLSSAWLWAEEFETRTPELIVFSNQTQSPVNFTDEMQVFPFSAEGARSYSSSYQFITGQLAESSTTVTLTPLGEEASDLNFSAHYTLWGRTRTSVIGVGTTVLEADPGTLITVAVMEGQSAQERWVFDGTSGTEVTFTAGANATYIVYELVQEMVSYAVAAGGQPLPPTLAPQILYDVAPPLASGTAGQLSITRLLSTTPVAIFALIGTQASLNEAVVGASGGERWAASSDNWTITTEGLVPEPIVLYQQYEVSVGYSVAWEGALPSPAPEFTAADFGALNAISLTGPRMAAWFDAGSAYSFSSLVVSPAGAERWVASGLAGSAPQVISTPRQEITELYAVQYYVHIGVNDARGGAVAGESRWFDAGSHLYASAYATKGWKFEGWVGSGQGGYTGASNPLDVVVSGPLDESATFYVQLEIGAGPGTSIAFSFPSQTGTVQAGTTRTLYVPPSNVTLRADPSSLAYSFSSWRGAVNSTTPSLVLLADTPSSVAVTSTFDLRGVLLLAAALAGVVSGVLLSTYWIRGWRRRDGRQDLPG